MYSKKQRIAAIIGLALTFCMIAGLIITALFDRSGRLFQAFLFAAIAVPILSWIYIWLYGRMTGKKTIADFSPEDTKDSISASDSDGSNAGDEGLVTISKRNPLQ